MKINKKIFSLMLALTLTVSMIPSFVASAASNYDDVAPSHWAYGVISRWSGGGYGVLNGDGDGNFSPDRGLSLGELAAILSKSFGYTDKVSVDVPQAWAKEFIEKAVAAGVYERAEFYDADTKVTREQAIKYIAIAYNIQPNGFTTTFVDDLYIGDEYKAYVNAFKQLGYIVGRGNNDFDPQAVYTRAEAMQVIDNTTSEILDYSDVGGEYSKALIVRNSNLTVRETKVEQNLIIGQGAYGGTVSLDNVSISGSLIILGSTEVSISNSTIQSVVIFGNGAKLLVNDGSTVLTVIVNSGNVTIYGNGDVRTVNVTEKSPGNVVVYTRNTTVTGNAIVPTPAASAGPSASPSAHPTSTAIVSSSPSPSSSPSAIPTIDPTGSPIAEPTNTAIAEPTTTPIAEPTPGPIEEPTPFVPEP